MIGIRPEHLELASSEGATDPAPDCVAEVEVDVVEPLGSVTLVHFHVDATPVLVGDGDTDEHDATFSRGEAPAAMVASVDGRSPVRSGTAPTRLHLRVDPASVHLFHPATGQAL